jgi:hypothetical protein
VKKIPYSSRKLLLQRKPGNESNSYLVTAYAAVVRCADSASKARIDRILAGEKLGKGALAQDAK